MRDAEPADGGRRGLMGFGAAVSEHPLATHAVGEVVGQVLEQVGPAPDVAVVFATGGFAGAMEDIASTVRATLAPSTLVEQAACGWQWVERPRVVGAERDSVRVRPSQI